MAYDPGTKTLTQIIADIKEWSRYTVADGEWLNDHDILPIKAALSKMASGTVNWPSGGNTGDVLTLTDATNRTVGWGAGGGGKTYTAGKWISKTQLDVNNVIECSGYHNLYAIDPLYFEEAPSGGSYPDGSVLLKTNGGGGGSINKSWAVYNYVAGSSEGPTNKQYGDDIDIVPPTSGKFLTDPFSITFSRAMTVQVNVSARFKVKPDMKDYVGEVGFEGTAVTNKIPFTMFGVADQTYAISTITSVPDAAVGTSLQFNPYADSVMVDDITQLTLSIHEI